MTVIETMGDLEEYLGENDLVLECGRGAGQWYARFRTLAGSIPKRVCAEGFGDSIARAIVACLADHGERERGGG